VNPTAIENVIQSILYPEFRCKLGINPTGKKDPFAFIDFTTKKITQKIQGGKEACLLQIGERLQQLHIKETSILIFDQLDNILCNHQFNVEVFKFEQGNTKKLRFLSDISFHFYQEKKSRNIYYSIWLKHHDKKITGFFQAPEDKTVLSQMDFGDILWVCAKLIKLRRLDLGQKEMPKMQIRIHEVDLAKNAWNIYNY